MALKPADDPTSIGCLLVTLGAVDDQQLHRAVELQQHTEPDQLLGMVMVANSMITHDQLEQAVKMQKALRGRRKDRQALAQAGIAEACMDRTTATAGRIREKIRMRFAGNNTPSK